MGVFVVEGTQVLTARSEARCALTSVAGRLCLAWTGTDGRLNLLNSVDGEAFDDQLTLAHRSTRRSWALPPELVETVTKGPALAPDASGLYLAWTGSDRRLNLWRMGFGVDGHQVLADSILDAPSVASTGDDFVLACAGIDRRLTLMRGRDGLLTERWTLEETSRQGPAVALHGDLMVLAWMRRCRLSLMQWTGIDAPEQWRLPAASWLAPALCVAGDHVVLAWVGLDLRINLATVRQNQLIGHTVTDFRTTRTPAIVWHNGRLYHAWVDSGRVNLARYRVMVPAP